MKKYVNLKLEDLIRMVDHEIQWLLYYSTADSRLRLNEKSDIYSTIEGMGYCKKTMPLYQRCSICLISIDGEIDNNTNLSELSIVSRPKGNFDYTPLEVFLKIYPSKKEEILNRLILVREDWTPFESRLNSIPKSHRIK